MVRVKNNRGDVTVSAVIAILSCALFFYLIQTITPLLTYKAQVINASTKANLMLSMENIRTTLNNTEALKTIVNLPENIAMKCLATATCTYNMAPQNLKVIGLDGTSLSDGTNVGVDRSGQPCSTVTEGPRCVFTIQIQWQPLCPADGSPCINPQVEISSQSSFTGTNLKFPLNFNNIDFKIRKADLGLLIL